VSAAEEVGIIRDATALLLDHAALVPPGPWHWERVLDRLVVCDLSGGIIARIPDSVSGGEDSAAWLAARDPRGARLEAALLKAITNEAEIVLKLQPEAVPAELAWRVSGYTEAFALARYIMEETA
jgi:hypothetical protein